jgi:hypothetical protein
MHQGGVRSRCDGFFGINDVNKGSDILGYFVEYGDSLTPSPAVECLTGCNLTEGEVPAVFSRSLDGIITPFDGHQCRWRQYEFEPGWSRARLQAVAGFRM